MKTNIVKEVFSKTELDQIWLCINKELSSREIIEWDDRVRGRTFDQGKKIYIKKRLLSRLEINKLELPTEILDKVIAIGHDLYNLEDGQLDRFIGVTYVEYTPKYGIPLLVAHKDYGQCGMILDYQLDANITWPIVLDGEEFPLENNELLSLFPLSQYHWRPAQKWNEGDFVKMLFFEFSTIGINRVEDDEKRMSINDKLTKEWEEISGGETL